MIEKKSTRKCRITCFSMVLLLISSSFTTVAGLYVDRFEDGSSEVHVILPGPGSDNKTSILLPVKGTVIGTSLRAGGNVSNITVDVGEDGAIDWGFIGTGYGALGHQNMFSDGTTGLDIQLANGANLSRDLLLPRSGSILGAKVLFKGQGTINMSWSSDRKITLREGRNTVEASFQDQAYLSPEVMDLDVDNDIDILIGHQDLVSPSSGKLTYLQGQGLNAVPSHAINGSFDTVTTAQTYVHPTLVDVDTDNDLDLVYGSIDGQIRFYKNDGTINKPVWTSNTSLFAGIDVGDYSAPSFADLNGDSQIDMVVGNSNGAFFFYNNSGTAMDPVFTEIPAYFSDVSVNNYATPHMTDIDGDSDIDMISGDGSGNLIMFQNNGTTSDPDMMPNTIYFNGTWPVSFRSSPTSYDADGDGDRDLCVGYANARLVLWRNQAGDGAPTPWDIMSDFTLGNTTKLHGQASAIELADINGDGLEDLIEVTEDSRFFGFDQVSHTWGVSFDPNSSSFASYQDPVDHMDPTFSDLDNDGDLDMLTGSEDGTLTFFRNTGSVSNPTWQKVPTWAPVQGIDVGQYSAPDLGDLNGDALPDMVIGADDGSLSYYQNTGTAADPLFILNVSHFSSIDHGPGGRTVPELLDIDGDNDLDLVLTYSTASGWGTTPDLYLNTGGAYAPTFSKDDTVLGVLGHVIESAHVGLVDTDLDDDRDLVMGGDFIGYLYQLENDPIYNIAIGVDGARSTYDISPPAEDFEVDLSSVLLSALGASQATADQYGNMMSQLELKVEAVRAFTASATFYIDYAYGPLMGSLVTTLNEYVTDNRDLADIDGMVHVPINITAGLSGTVRLFGLNITVDEPPTIMEPLTGHSIDEDTKDNMLIDLLTFFDDDFTGDNDLVFTMEVGDSPVNVSLRQDRWVSVDAETGVGSDNWTGDIPIRLNATDSLGQTTTTGFFNVTVKAINDDPVIHSTPPRTAIVDELYEHWINATDVDGDTLRYSLAANPNGMMINSSSGRVSWTPTQADLGPHLVTFIVNDGTVSINQSFTLNVRTPPPINHLPVIVSEPVTVAFIGLIYQYNVDATDEDEDTLNYLLPPGNRPAGMMINYTNGVINWVPNADQIGEHNVSVVVTDNKDNVTQDFSVTVLEIDLPPQITSSPRTTASVGVMYTYTVTATDPEGVALKFKIANGPIGMTIDDTTGEIKWLPTGDQTGTANVKVEVSDNNNVANQTFNIHVSYLQPTVWITSHRDGDEVYGSITIKGTAAITSGNIVRVRVMVDDKDWKQADGRESWTFRLDTTKLTDGTHTITAISFSEHAESEPTSVTVTVKNGGGGKDLTMMIAILVLLVVIIVVAIVAMVLMRRRMGKAPSKDAIVAPLRVRKRADDDDEIPEEEMDKDLEAMGLEAYEDE